AARSRWRGRAWAIVMGATMAASAGATEPTQLPRFVAGPLDIDCSTTPFGLHAELAQDIEGVSLIDASSFNVIDEYQPAGAGSPTPYVRNFRVNRPAALNGASLQSAVDIDLDGNGRD